jgi:periplasmic divalent cation tolerance protein
MSDYVIVLVTLPADRDPAPMAGALVDARLAACVNVLPAMRSVYRWQGQVEEASEHQLLIKTTRDRVEALRERVRELHPYDVPEFLVVPASGGDPAYLEWIRDSTKRDAPG